MERNEIIVFTLDGCEHCQELKTKLKENNIIFREIETTKNKYIWEQMIEQTGFDHIPSIFIKRGNTNTGPIYIPGRDFNSFDEIIDIIKNYI